MGMQPIEFEIYVQQNGRSPFLQWHDSLPPKDRQKLDETIQKVSEYGISVALRMEWVKKLEDNLWEIRSKLGSNAQRACYFHLEQDRYVITHGFTKKTQKTPKKEIRKAREIRTSYLRENQ